MALPQPPKITLIFYIHWRQRFFIEDITRHNYISCAVAESCATDGAWCMRACRRYPQLPLGEDAAEYPLPRGKNDTDGKCQYRLHLCQYLNTSGCWNSFLPTVELWSLAQFWLRPASILPSIPWHGLEVNAIREPFPLCIFHVASVSADRDE